MRSPGRPRGGSPGSSGAAWPAWCASVPPEHPGTGRFPQQTRLRSADRSASAARSATWAVECPRWPALAGRPPRSERHSWGSGPVRARLWASVLRSAGHPVQHWSPGARRQFARSAQPAPYRASPAAKSGIAHLTADLVGCLIVGLAFCPAPERPFCLGGVPVVPAIAGRAVQGGGRPGS